MKIDIVLDTNVVLYLVKSLLSAPLPDAAFGISIVSVIELLSFPKMLDSEKLAIEELLSELTVLQITDEVRDYAIQFRRDSGLKLPDAVIAASAIAHQAVLLTNDSNMSRADGVRCQAVQVML